VHHEWPSGPLPHHACPACVLYDGREPRPHELSDCPSPARLRRVHGAWSCVPPSPDRCMLWGAFCLGFFGFLGAGEFTCPSQSVFSHEMLEARDVLVDSLHISKCGLIAPRPIHLVLASHYT
jgi:hypothetical protein